MWLASRNGHTDIVKMLLQHGAEVDSKDKVSQVVRILNVWACPFELYIIQDGYTALHIASLKGHPAIVEELVEWGAQINHKQKV